MEWDETILSPPVFEVSDEDILGWNIRDPIVSEQSTAKHSVMQVNKEQTKKHDDIQIRS